ncbi:MAG: 2-oxoacid:acceptor oxidoreductase family protein [Clostridia bacterium]|nr:2-oxoacid:acceptor oxidoreductase family protein [Clostridia bacterium]
MNNFEILNELEENGIFILNTTNPNIEEYLSDSVKKQIVTKNIKFYTINAFELARRVGLGNKISTIIEACILHLSNVIDSDIAINKLKEEIRLRFNTIKPEVVEPNLLAIDEAISNLKEVKISGEFKESKININNVYEAMFHRMGDDLKVSDFKDMEDGKMDINTSSKEKRMISMRRTSSPPSLFAPGCPEAQPDRSRAAAMIKEKTRCFIGNLSFRRICQVLWMANN